MPTTMPIGRIPTLAPAASPSIGAPARPSALEGGATTTAEPDAGASAQPATDDSVDSSSEADEIDEIDETDGADGSDDADDSDDRDGADQEAPAATAPTLPLGDLTPPSGYPTGMAEPNEGASSTEPDETEPTQVMPTVPRLGNDLFRVSGEELR